MEREARGRRVETWAQRLEGEVGQTQTHDAVLARREWYVAIPESDGGSQRYAASSKLMTILLPSSSSAA